MHYFISSQSTAESKKEQNQCGEFFFIGTIRNDLPFPTITPTLALLLFMFSYILNVFACQENSQTENHWNKDLFFRKPYI